MYDLLFIKILLGCVENPATYYLNRKLLLLLRMKSSRDLGT